MGYNKIRKAQNDSELVETQQAGINESSSNAINNSNSKEPDLKFGFILGIKIITLLNIQSQHSVHQRPSVTANIQSKYLYPYEVFKIFLFSNLTQLLNINTHIILIIMATIILMSSVLIIINMYMNNHNTFIYVVKALGFVLPLC